MAHFEKLEDLVMLDDEKFEQEVRNYPAWLLYDIAQALQEKNDEDYRTIARRLKLFALAKDKGDPRAITFLGGLCASSGDDDESALYYFHKAIDKYSHPEAMLNLAIFYREKGKYGQCVYYLNKAVEHHAKGALVHLGCCYSEGLGVKRDPKRARELFDEAIAHGDVDAMYYKAISYLPKDGEECDLEEAVDNCKLWLQKASMQGVRKATETYFVCTYSERKKR